MSVLAVEEYEELQVNFELEQNLRKRAESFAQEVSELLYSYCLWMIFSLTQLPQMREAEWFLFIYKYNTVAGVLLDFCVWNRSHECGHSHLVHWLGMQPPCHQTAIATFTASIVLMNNPTWYWLTSLKQVCFIFIVWKAFFFLLFVIVFLWQHGILFYGIQSLFRYPSHK